MCFAQGTAFTYQGQLQDGANPANGIYDLRFTIYDSTNNPGVLIAGPVTNSLTSVNGGRFTVTLDFGTGVFNGSDRWLEIGVRTNAGGTFSLLTPRQKMTPTPYALFAPNAGVAASAGSVVAGAVGAAGLQDASVTSPKIADGSITAADVNSASFSNMFWKMDGNAGTVAGIHFLGTTDNRPLELRLNNSPVLRFNPTASNNAVNVVAGSSLNFIEPSVLAGTVAGGGLPSWAGGTRSNVVAANFGTVGGGADNQVGKGASSGVIGGGFGNRLGESSADSTVGGGSFNVVNSNSLYGTIAGGSQHAIGAGSISAVIGGGFGSRIGDGSLDATISGGAFHLISSNSARASIGGGFQNVAGGVEATVSGGAFNRAIAFSAAIGGGGGNSATGAWSTVAGGRDNVVATNADYAAIGGGWQNAVEAEAQYAVIPGGLANVAAGDYSFAGGQRSKAMHDGAFVWTDATGSEFASTTSNQFNVRANGGVRFETGGAGMSLDSQPVVIGGSNAVSLTNFANVLAGDGSGLTSLNASQLTSGTVPEGALDNAWKVGGNLGTIPGLHYLGTLDAQPLELRVRNMRAFRLEPDPFGSPNLIGGGGLNNVSPGVRGTMIGGGDQNMVGSSFAGIGSGQVNSIGTNSPYSFIGGGQSGQIGANAQGNTVAGGLSNWIAASNYSGFIGGGTQNRLGTNGDAGVVAGGWGNSIGSDTRYGFIGGGFQNAISAGVNHGTISGGWFNTNRADRGVIGGGERNLVEAGANDAIVAGGYQNSVRFNAFNSSIGGGSMNAIDSNAAYSTIAGGAYNRIGSSAAYATIPGGLSNSVTASYGFAAGNGAKANHLGTFVWSDSQNADFASTANNQFLIRASGGVGVNTNDPSGAALNVAGQVRASTFAGSGANLTSLNASQLSSGTLPSAALSGTYSGGVTFNNAANSYTGNGAGLTSLHASQLTAGTVPDARLSANVALRDATQTFTGNNAFLGSVAIGTTPAVAPLTVLATNTFYGIEHTDGTHRLSTYLDANGGWLGTVSSDPLNFYVNNGGVAMRLDLSERLGLGRTPTANKLEVEGNASKTAAGSWLANSDARIKQDIQPVSGALQKLDQVRLVSFRYTDDYRAQHPTVEDRRYLNVVAQEFREVFPEHVKSSGEVLPDGSEILQVDTYPLTIYSAAAVRELNQKLEQKQTEITELKQRLAALEQIVARLDQKGD